METKICTTCKKSYPISEYRKDASRANGIHCTCNSCNREIQRRWYQNNKEKAQLTARNSYAKKKDAINLKRRLERINNPDAVRAKARKQYNPITSKVSSWKRIGIKDMTYDRYLSMLSEQNNCCAICGIESKNLKRKLDVDHDHITGIARGLLCTPCNSGIGKLKDSVEMLEKAISYLKQYDKKQ